MVGANEDEHHFCVGCQAINSSKVSSSLNTDDDNDTEAIFVSEAIKKAMKTYQLMVRK